MTTTRIDHTGHPHANTTAARTACRKAMTTPTSDYARESSDVALAPHAHNRRGACTCDGMTTAQRARNARNARNAADAAAGRMARRPVAAPVVDNTPTPTTVTAPHCQACGGVLDTDCGAWDGYTSCCNERVVGGYGTPCTPADCYHA
jgi:hypothetical protein